MDVFPSKQDTSFADAIKGHTFERVLKKYTRLLAVSFNVSTKIAAPNNGENQEKALQEIFGLFIKEGPKIDKNFGILPWKEDKPLPTVYNVEQIRRLSYDSLIQYINGPIQGRYIKQIVTGRNYRWRVNATFTIGKPEIFHERWGRVVLNTLTVGDFPTQTEQ